MISLCEASERALRFLENEEIYFVDNCHLAFFWDFCPEKCTRQYSESANPFGYPIFGYWIRYWQRVSWRCEFGHQKSHSTRNLGIEKCVYNFDNTLNYCPEKYPFLVLDSSGDFETNFIWQNVYWLGSREFCSVINSPIPVYTETKTKSVQKLLNDLPPFQLDYRLLYGDIKSKYQIFYEYTITTVLHLGLCVPKSCSDEDIFSMSQKYFSEHRVHPFFDLEVHFTHVRNMKFDWAVFNNWIFKLLMWDVFL